MKPNGIESITEGQKECLRLVYQHRQSKEIARMLGISKASVDQRIDGARAKLGNVSRVEAARMLAAAEGTPIPDPIAYDPIPVAFEPTSIERPSPIGASAGLSGFLPWPTRDHPENDLGWFQRVVAICLVALLGLLCVALLVSIMNGIGGLVRR
ncbi:helix-turn-helix transcriptional regulator [Sphingomonas tabacisoli]|uniref:Helix-turn-helix transcriptional regulator n=1 Tax=Sphingomonas tabacisoli TaxID=2249466 RepID=A0ABW4I6A9_9SPHN